MDSLAKMLDTKQLAEQLGVESNTLEKWRLKGLGPPHYRLERRVVYDPRDVAQWLAERKCASTSVAAN